MALGQYVRLNMTHIIFLGHGLTWLSNFDSPADVRTVECLTYLHRFILVCSRKMWANMEPVLCFVPAMLRRSHRCQVSSAGSVRPSHCKNLVGWIKGGQICLVILKELGLNFNLSLKLYWLLGCLGWLCVDWLESGIRQIYSIHAFETMLQLMKLFPVPVLISSPLNTICIRHCQVSAVQCEQWWIFPLRSACSWWLACDNANPFFMEESQLNG